MFIALVRLIDCYKEIKILPQENIALVSLGTKALWNISYFDYLVLIPKPSEQSGGLIIKWELCMFDVRKGGPLY